MTTLWLALLLLSQNSKTLTVPENAGWGGEEGRRGQANSYVLGPEDLLSIRIFEAPEIADKPVRIDHEGYIELHLLGRIKAAGQTLDELQRELTRTLRVFIHEPQVSVSIEEFRSQPVSVIGAVGNPGVHQLRGQKTLIEMLSLAGGLRADAGHVVKITRRMEWGRIPLAGAQDDPTGRFSVGQVSLRTILLATNPEENILILPHDVISVPRAEMVYVVGEVRKSGGFVLHEREKVSVLQALSLAEGLNATAAPGEARVLRQNGSAQRTEIPVDLRKILSGKDRDVDLQPDDILFIPGSNVKKATFRAVEAAIQLGTGVVIWRR